MLKSHFHRRIARMGQAFDYDVSYLHELLEASTPAFIKFALFQPMSRHREDVPATTWFAAKLAATMSEDCGPCSQLMVDMAIRAGVAPAIVAALARGDLTSADADASLGFRYGHAVAANAPEADAFAAQALAKYGRRGVASLAMAVAAARVYPTLKRGLGHGAACQKLVVGEEAIAVEQVA